jgi:hypothetical protein
MPVSESIYTASDVESPIRSSAVLPEVDYTISASSDEIRSAAALPSRRKSVVSGIAVMRKMEAAVVASEAMNAKPGAGDLQKPNGLESDDIICPIAKERGEVQLLVARQDPNITSGQPTGINDEAEFGEKSVDWEVSSDDVSVCKEEVESVTKRAPLPADKQNSDQAHIAVMIENTHDQHVERINADEIEENDSDWEVSSDDVSL